MFSRYRNKLISDMTWHMVHAALNEIYSCVYAKRRVMYARMIKHHVRGLYLRMH